jgi:hypothetical protein
MNIHMNIEYGETCLMYPCEECGFIGEDLKALKDHIKDVHEHSQEQAASGG